MLKNFDVTPQTVCEAKTRSGVPCQNATMPNGRCHLHGGKSTGPRTVAGIERIRQSHWKHGKRSAQAKAEQKEFRRLFRLAKQLRKEIEEGQEDAKTPDELASKGEILAKVESDLLSSTLNSKYLNPGRRFAAAMFLQKGIMRNLESSLGIPNRQKR